MTKVKEKAAKTEEVSVIEEQAVSRTSGFENLLSKVKEAEVGMELTNEFFEWSGEEQVERFLIIGTQMIRSKDREDEMNEALRAIHAETGDVVLLADVMIRSTLAPRASKIAEGAESPFAVEIELLDSKVKSGKGTYKKFSIHALELK